MSLEIFNFVSVIVGLIGLIIAVCHLKGIKTSLEHSNLMSNFKIEFELNRRKEQLAASLFKSLEILNNQTNNGNMAKVTDIYCKEAYENYLNAFDRLAYFILKKRLNGEDFRTEYRDMLSDTIKEDMYGVFNKPNNCYRNMTKLNNIWKEK